MANYVDYKTGAARMAPFRARRIKNFLRRLNHPITLLVIILVAWTLIH